MDSKYIVSGSEDRTVRLWDAVTGAEVKKMEGHSSGVASVAFSVDSKYIVSGSWDSTVRLWDAVTHRGYGGATHKDDRRLRRRTSMCAAGGMLY